MKKTIRDFNLKNKKVIIRCDFNVPIKDGKIIDDTRIKNSLETIKYAIDKNAKVILLSHLGRIKEESDKVKNNLDVVAKKLSKLLNKKVIFVDEVVGEKVETAISKMKDKDVILLQNTRYEDLDGKKESKCDLEFAKQLASYGDIFINDAFGTIHRAHASNYGISKYLESGIGFLVEKELEKLSILNNPEDPFVIIMGGAKVADKIGVIDNLLPKCDKLLIGGGMAFTFLQAEGYEIGNSIFDADSLEYCQKLLKEYPNKIVLPIDVACSTEYKDSNERIEKDINEIDFHEMGLDIGEKTLNLFEKYLKEAKTVFWNGPLGVYEFSLYAKNTDELLTYLGKSKAKVVLGGGDIVAAASKLSITDKFYHVSTGGGATLEYLSGKELPGLENIEEKEA